VLGQELQQEAVHPLVPPQEALQQVLMALLRAQEQVQELAAQQVRVLGLAAALVESLVKE
jgi:hypothetical protein